MGVTGSCLSPKWQDRDEVRSEDRRGFVRVCVISAGTLYSIVGIANLRMDLCSVILSQLESKFVSCVLIEGCVFPFFGPFAMGMCWRCRVCMHSQANRAEGPRA